MIQYTYTPIQYNEEYVYKLKLERLMYKANALAWGHHSEMDLPRPTRSVKHHYRMMGRWESLYRACADKLEELKKCK